MTGANNLTLGLLISSEEKCFIILTPGQDDVKKYKNSADLVNGDDSVLFRQIAPVQDELVGTEASENEGGIVAVPPGCNVYETFVFVKDN